MIPGDRTRWRWARGPSRRDAVSRPATSWSYATRHGLRLAERCPAMVTREWGMTRSHGAGLHSTGRSPTAVGSVASGTESSTTRSARGSRDHERVMRPHAARADRNRPPRDRRETTTSTGHADARAHAPSPAACAGRGERRSVTTGEKPTAGPKENAGGARSQPGAEHGIFTV